MERLDGKPDGCENPLNSQDDEVAVKKPIIQIIAEEAADPNASASESVVAQVTAAVDGESTYLGTFDCAGGDCACPSCTLNTQNSSGGVRRLELDPAQSPQMDCDCIESDCS